MNYKLFKALDEFLKAMRPFVVNVIQSYYPNDNWEDIYYNKLSPEKQETWNRAIGAGTSAQERIDYNNLKVFVLAFKTELIQDLGRIDANTLVSNLIELCNLRNQCNHFQTIEHDDVEYAFSIMKKIARLLDWSDLRSKLASIWNNFDESNPPEPNLGQEREEVSASETANDPEGNLELPNNDADAQDEIIRITGALELPDNAFEAREDIIKKIIKKINSLYKIEDKFKGITIYVSNPLLKLHIDNDEFKKQLSVELDNNELNSLFDSEDYSIVISTDTTPADAIIVMPGLAIVLTKRGGKKDEGGDGKPQSTGKIKISIFEGQGSLKNTEYELDSSVKEIFHIGWSRSVRAKGPIRINDVVIKDDETDAELKKLNSKVSRSHADIVWRDGRFFLKAMPSGCRPEGGAATKVFRDEKEIELLSSSMLFPLCDGDLIGLGREAVILQVKIVK